MSVTRYQVVFDCADPHRMARFWSDALDFVVEENSAFVRQLLDGGVISDDDVVEVDGRLFFRTLVACRDPDGPVDERGAGMGRRLLFQLVPEPKTVKNRLHLDLHVGREQVDAEIERLTGLGASVLYTHDDVDGFWVTLSDPEGNEFCVA